MIRVRQIRVGGLDSNFSYLLYDANTFDAAIVDPCGDVGLIKEECGKLPDIKPCYILITHGHHDHISGIEAVERFFKAPVVSHPLSTARHDIGVSHKQKLRLGNSQIECLHAPGHTTDSVIYRICDDTAIFTGDTLFIDWCGYCEPESMFATMKKVVFPLADSNIVYPGHDYGHVPCATLGSEKITNPYLSAATLEEFKKHLENL